MTHVKLGILAACVALTLTGCTTQATANQVDIVNQQRGLPKALQLPSGSSDYGPSIHWSNQQRNEITFVAYGSGSCPTVPETYTVKDATHLTLNLHEYKGACTADLGPHTTVFSTPAQLDKEKTITVTLHGNEGQTDTNLKLKTSPTLADL